MNATVQEQQVVVVLGDEERTVPVSLGMDVAAELVRAAGNKGVPLFFNPDGSPFVQKKVVEEKVSISKLLRQGPVRASMVSHASSASAISQEGKARSEADRAAAEAAGFTTKETVFARGSRVVQLGVQNAQKSYRKWEKMPLAVDEAHRLRDEVIAEDRQNETVPLHGLRMTSDGRIGQIVGSVEESRAAAKSVTKAAFSSLVTRAGFGGASYLYDECDDELRSLNWNRQMKKVIGAFDQTVATAEVQQAIDPGIRIPQAPVVVLGTRKPGGDSENVREIFRAVSERYTAFDLDKICDAFAVAMKDLGGRGKASYDGNRARLEAIFHSDIQPQDYVAGEFFKAGIVINTDDTGGGSIKGSACVVQNLCLNLIIIDRASQPLFQLRHMGDFDKLVAAFKKGVASGQEKIGHFLKAWGFATHDNIIEEARKLDEHVPMTVEEALGGFFRGVLDRELVPVKGRTEDNVRHLLDMYEKDDSAATQQGFLTRAAVVNAFTRYAHEINKDPFREDVICQSAAGLLYGRGKSRPAPLPWAPLPSEAKKLGQ